MLKILKTSSSTWKLMISLAICRHHSYSPENEVNSIFLRLSGIGPSKLLLDMLKDCNWVALNSGIWPLKWFPSNLNSKILGNKAKDSGTPPENLLCAKCTFFNETIPEKASSSISPENWLLDKKTDFSALSFFIFGMAPSKWLFMKLIPLRWGNFARVSMSMVPMSPIPSSCNPQTSPFMQITPTQPPGEPPHGVVDVFQLPNAVTLRREFLNSRRISDWDGLAPEATLMCTTEMMTRKIRGQGE